MVKSVINSSIEALLWDVNIREISISKHKKFIIERVLEFGDIPEVRWLLDNYSLAEIESILKTSKRISKRSGAFYINILGFNLNENTAECLKKPYTQRQNRF